jgi:thioredoxin reductase (NADPH)
MEVVRDLIVVGSGPGGLTAALYGARANLHPLLLAGEPRGLELPGGQLMITTDVENYPGFPEGIKGPELMDRFMKQVSRFGTEIIEQHVEEISVQDEWPFRVRSGEEWYSCRSLILAPGAYAKWLDLPSEERLRNKGLSACAVCDGALLAKPGSHVMVIGGGDTAMEEALYLTRFAGKVTIVHRRDELRASRIMQKRAKENPKIELLLDSLPVDYLGDDEITGLRVKNKVSGEESDHEANAVFVAIGHKPNTDFLRGSGVELDEAGYVVVNHNVETNVEGVFAAGDVHDTHYRQAVTAAGFGCMAAIRAERWLESKEAE